MTCIEKLREKYPKFDEENIRDIIAYFCPEDFNIIKLGSGGLGLDGVCVFAGQCQECWSFALDKEVE